MLRFTALASAWLLIAGSIGAHGAAAQPAGPRTESTPSLSVTPVTVPEGTLRIYLPSDMAAGDTISGTVVAEPAGSNDDQRRENTATLNGYVVDLGTSKPAVAQHAFTFVVPAAAAAALIVRRANGAEVKRTSVPVRPPQPPFSGRPAAGDFHFPRVIAAGQPFAVSGPFTGDVAKSALSVGTRPVDVIAESPRTFVAAAPPNVSGPATYQLRENGVAATAPCNVLKIDLSAPVTHLTRGERTTLHVAVSGLDGLREPVPLRIVNATPDAIALAGGAAQALRIAPADVRPGGTYAVDRQITGLRAGSFSLYATVDQQNQTYASGAPATPVVSQPPMTQASATPHAARNPITSDWPQLSDADKKAVQAFIDAAAAAKTAAGVRKAREDALAELVKAMKKYCCNFDTMQGGAPVYDPATEGEGATERAKGGQVSIGTDAFSSVAWLYSSLKHEMVHSQQWQDADAAGKLGSNGRERQAYQREVDNAGNTGLSAAEKAEDERRLGQYK